LVRAVALTDNGSQAISGDTAGVIRIWTLKDRKLLRSVNTKEGEWRSTPCYSFSQDGKFALVGANSRGNPPVFPLPENCLKLWDLEKGVCVRSFPIGPDQVTHVALSPDGKWALATVANKYVIPENGDRFPYSLYATQLWNVASGKLEKTLLQDCFFPAPVVFSKDGTRYAAGGSGNTPGRKPQPSEWDAKIWDTETGAELQTFPPTDHWPIWSVALSADNRSIAVGSHRAVRIWEKEAKASRCSFTDKRLVWDVKSMTFAPDSKSILVAGPHTDYLESLPQGQVSPGRLILLDTANGREVRDFLGLKTWIRAATFSKDGSAVAAGIDSGVTIFDTATGKQVLRLNNNE
jgi:WD40 repeat protein